MTTTLATTQTTYESQQDDLVQAMIVYLQDPDNWVGGVALITDFSTGSVTYTLLSSISVALDNIAQQIFDAQQQSSILTATGSALDNICQNWGVSRKPALAANGSFTFTKNTDATVAITIPANTLISTLPDDQGNVVEYLVDTDTTLPVGSTSVQVQATCSNPGPGSAGNLTIATPVVIGSALPGIDSVQIDADIDNGVDEESDDSLRLRCLEEIQNPQGGGTPTDYHEWAIGVAGVNSATALPKNRGNGTVDVVITAQGGSLVPSSTLISQVQSVINGLAPIDVDVQVVPPTVETVDATISISVSQGNTVAGLTSAVQTAVENYINSIAIGGTVYGSGIVSSVLKVSGVTDATCQLSVGGTNYTNVVIGSTTVAQSGTTTVQGM